MIRPRHLAAGLAALGVCATLATTAAAQQDPARPPAPVGLELERLAAQQATVAVIVDAVPGFTWPGLAPFGDGTYLRGVIPADQLAALRAAPGVEWVEADLPLEPDGASQNAQVDADQLDAQGFDGTNRTVAVIDTGVDFSHGDLAPANRGEACFEATGSCPGGTTSSVGPGSAAPVGLAHGTLVAGLVAARGATTPGAANDSGVYAIRVFGTGGNASTSDVIAAMQHVRAVAPSHAAAGRPIVAANMSLGSGGPFGPCPGGPTAAEIGALAAAGISPVVSAGNDGFTGGVGFPGCVPAAFTVGGVQGENVVSSPPLVLDGGQNDTLASFSNSGAAVDVLAPACARSTAPGGYSSSCGTSFSAPLVSAIIADLSDARPGSSRQQREVAVAESGVFVADHRVPGGGFARYRVSGTDALSRVDSVASDGWRWLGDSVTSGPDAASWAPGRVDVFARAGDGQLLHSWRSEGLAWEGSELLGGGLNGDPGAVSWAPGRLDIFIRGTDNALWHRFYDGGWSGWGSLGGVLTSEPDVSSWAPGRLDVFARGADGALWHRWFDGGWSVWESLGGFLPAGSGPGAASWSNGRIDVFVRGADDALWHRWFDGGWSVWESLGGVLASSPDASKVALQPGRVDVAVRGVDNGVHYQRFNGAAWSGWVGVGGFTDSAPTVASWNAEPVAANFVVRGPDGALWHRSARP